MKVKFVRVRSNKQQEGFTLIETVMASMVSLLFLSLGANLVLAANIQKIVAQRNITMSNFIQSDLEVIKYQANLLALDNTKCNPGNAEHGYAGALKDKLGSNPPVTMKISGHDYTMNRSIENITDANILPISYKFTRNRSTTSEHQLYIEIIPNAAFTCPST
jgi:type II secretory pathway pseudopilin PulG